MKIKILSILNIIVFLLVIGINGLGVAPTGATPEFFREQAILRAHVVVKRDVGEVRAVQWRRRVARRHDTRPGATKNALEKTSRLGRDLSPEAGLETQVNRHQRTVGAIKAAP